MKEQLITFKTAKLAKEKGFNIRTKGYYNDGIYKNTGSEIGQYHSFTNGKPITEDIGICLAPTQSLLQKFIREIRGVHIEIHRNASGYYWSMCRSDGGTDLGWSGISGPNAGGVWDKYEDALEHALQIQLSYDLPNDLKVIKHWGNYVEFAFKSR